VTARPGGDDAIEVHLPDGGHVIIAMEDQATRQSGFCDELIPALLAADGSEHDIEEAILAQAGRLGLHCDSSSSHPTVIVVRPSPEA
jgi:hypothetical protein